MTPEEAIQLVIQRYPFEGYIPTDRALHSAHSTIAKTVQRHLPAGGKILDFGCGPCDKTAVLQFLGFQCTGYDDLQDAWHQMPGSQEKILAFAEASGIDFKLATASVFPFVKASFDMIMLHGVIEHLHDSPRDLLNDLLEFIKPEGLLFITVPSAVNIRKRIDVCLGKTNFPSFDTYYWYPNPWRGHIREYVADDLKKLAAYLNVEVLDLRAFDQMLEKLPRALRRVYLLVTWLLPGWKDSWLVVARKPPGWVPTRTPHGAATGGLSSGPA